MAAEPGHDFLMTSRWLPIDFPLASHWLPERRPNPLDSGGLSIDYPVFVPRFGVRWRTGLAVPTTGCGSSALVSGSGYGLETSKWMGADQIGFLSWPQKFGVLA